MLRSARAALCLVPALLAIASTAHADDPPPLPPNTPPPPGAQPPPPGYGQPPPGYGQPPPGYGQPPPGYYPQYGQPYYPNPAQQDTRPLTMDYEEGEPIPAGYHLRTRMRTKLIGAGAGVMGGMWILSTIIGAIANSAHERPVGDGRTDLWTPMYVPVVGPFITIGTASSDLSSGGTALIVFDGLAQTGGLAMLILGIALPEKKLVRDALVLEPTEGVTVTPTVGVGSLGFSGTF
ncbi:MAG: hypothetical protein R3B70_02195 [Polyangiaceae bacterium]